MSEPLTIVIVSAGLFAFFALIAYKSFFRPEWYLPVRGNEKYEHRIMDATFKTNARLKGAVALVGMTATSYAFFVQLPSLF